MRGRKTRLPEARVEWWISSRLTQYLKEEGIEIITGAKVKGIEDRGKVKIITAEVDGKERRFKGEVLLVGVGITPNSGEIGLEGAGEGYQPYWLNPF